MISKFTQGEVKAIIMKWAENKANEKDEDSKIEFDASFCKGAVVRYKTSEMTSLIPDNTEGKLSGFDDGTRPDHYAYEIECRTTVLNLMLSFSYTNISDETKKNCDELLKKFKMMPKLDNEESGDNFFRLCIYDISIKDCKHEEEIRAAMDKLFYEMKGYEKFICYKMDEEKKRKAK